MTSLKQNLTKTKTPVVKSAWYHTCRSLEKLLSNLSVKSLDDFQFFYYYYYYLLFFQFYESISSETQVTVIPNFKNKEQLGGSMLVRGKSMEATGRDTSALDGTWEKGHD